MSNKTNDLIVLDEGEEASVVQACCKSAGTAKL